MNLTHRRRLISVADSTADRLEGRETVDGTKYRRFSDRVHFDRCGGWLLQKGAAKLERHPVFSSPFSFSPLVRLVLISLL